MPTPTPMSNIEKELRPIVRRYGHERVARCLHTMQPDHPETNGAPNSPAARPSRGHVLPDAVPRKRKPASATDYVKRMQLPFDRAGMLSQLASKFEQKTFLPTLSETRRFCRVHGIASPTSRGGSVPRVFKFLAQMPLAEVDDILRHGMFSGPTRLGPIADAIAGWRDAPTASTGPDTDRAQEPCGR